MKLKPVLEGQYINRPLNIRSFWAAQSAPSDGVVISLNDVERNAGGVFLSIAKLYEILNEIERLEKSEKNS